MSEEPEAPQEFPAARQLALTLALGWSAAELVGRYRHGIHPRNPAARKSWQGRDLPRLSYSSRALASNNDLCWLSAQRLIILSDELGLDDLEGKGEEGSVDTRLRALPDEIRQYVERKGASPTLEPEAFYRLLDDWTQLARLELGVRSKSLQEAFSFAGDLADLYWTLPVPQRYNLSQWAQAWRKMLYKLPRALRGLRRVKASLPRFAFEAIEQGLEEWGKARPAWLEGEVTLEQARELSRRFGEQARIWGEVLQGERTPQDYLSPTDARWIAFFSMGSFIVALALLLVIAAGAVVGGLEFIIWVVIPFVRGFFPQAPSISGLVKAPSVSDWLAIGGVVAAAGGLLVSAGVWLFHRLGDIYRWIWDGFTGLLVRRRTVIPWR